MTKPGYIMWIDGWKGEQGMLRITMGILQKQKRMPL